MRCLLLLALLAGVVAGKSVHLGTAPAALQAPRRELRQSVNCAKCKPSYGMRMRMAGKCEATVCLWFQARGAKDSTSMCWDLDAQWTNLLIKNAPISIDTKFDVYWDYENEADEKSAVLVLDKINDDCWTQCKVISGYEAKIACE